MRLSMGLPGESRQDKEFTAKVKSENGLGQQAGKWQKMLYPPEALADVKSIDGEAQAYHDTVTLTFDRGIGILSAALVKEYADKMREFKGRREAAVEAGFLADPQKLVDWAKQEQNGTFNPKNYPGCDVYGSIDAETFRSAMRPKFRFRTEPLPVPDSSHFETEVSALLGVDAASVDQRVEDAVCDARRELMQRLIDPVQRMAEKLVEEPAEGKADIIFRDTLIGNIMEIAALAPKLNIAGDPQIDKFAAEMEALTRYTPKVLRDDKNTRSEAAAKAKEMLDRLTGYKL
jgi:hypothetical protein